MPASIGYKNLFDSATTVTASSSPAGFEKENAYDWKLFDFWKPGAGTQTLSATFAAPVTANYFAFYGHNLGSERTALRLQYSTAGSGGPWTSVQASTDVAFFDAALEELRMYRWGGAAWSLVGAGLSIVGAGTPTLARLNATDVAFLDETLESLSVYRFSGSAWSLVGSSLSIAGIGGAALTALNSTDVAFIDSTLESLRVYRFNGTTFAQVGSGFSIAGIGKPSLAALNATDVAFLDEALEELRLYRWSGSAWSLVGSGLSIAGISNPALTALNATDVAFIDGTLDELRTYRFNGSTWSLVGSGLSIPAAGSELVTNGDMATTASWTLVNATSAIVGGKLRVTSIANGSFTARQSLAPTSGKQYILSYDFDSVSMTGTTFVNVSGMAEQQHLTGAALTNNLTYISGGSGNLTFNGSTTSLAGDYFDIDNVSLRLADIPALATLNSTDVAYIDPVLESLRVYRFDGSAWSLVGSGLSIADIGNPALSAPALFTAPTANEVTMFRFSDITAQDWRVELTNCTADTKIGMIAFGEVTILPDSLRWPFTPGLYQAYESDINLSQTMLPLGNTKAIKPLDFTLTQSFLTPAEVEDTIIPLIQHFETTPGAFFAWVDPVTGFADDPLYVFPEQIQKHPAYTHKNLMKAEIKLKGIRD